MHNDCGAVLCVGHATVDSVYGIDRFPARPLKVPASHFNESIGGMAANAACAVARLGGRAVFWGPLGSDGTADKVMAEFVQAGVDASRAFRVRGASTSHSAIVVDGAGERLIISHRGSALEAQPDQPDLLPAAAIAMIDVRWTAGAVAIARRLRQAGVPVVVDGEMGNVALLRELATLADFLIFSENGFAEWSGRVHDDAGRLDALRALVGQGRALAAVTCGEHGVWYAHAGRHGCIPAFAVEAVETLGAGDTFHGAFALAMVDAQLQSDDDLDADDSQCPAVPALDATAQRIERALRFASAAAALKCSRRGGRVAMPDRAETMALLRSAGSAQRRLSAA